MANTQKSDQVEEQLALLQLGSIFKDIIPSTAVDGNYLPTDLAEVALVLERELSVIVRVGDSITELRDRAVTAYNKSFNNTYNYNTKTGTFSTDAFDYAMKGV